MDPEELKALVEAGPVTIRMNDGRSYKVPSREYVLIGQMSAVVLHKGDDGKWRNITLPLVTMTGADQVA
ncbi:MAG: hypothetical protein AAGA03_18965 [Planctomycetota bacterium]